MDRYISPQGSYIFCTFLEVRNNIIQKLAEMDMDTFEVVHNNLLTLIRRVHNMLRGGGVRGQEQPAQLMPDVFERCSYTALFHRLRGQVEAIAALADACHRGPAASAEELLIIEEMTRALTLLKRAVSPAASLEGSATDSD